MIDEKLIRWRCRRGMKELDVMLERFLACGFRGLDARQKAAFGELLDALDPDLFAWLTGNATPDQPHLGNIVAVIRHDLTRPV
jgi:antitoxin CptB